MFHLVLRNNANSQNCKLNFGFSSVCIGDVTGIGHAEIAMACAKITAIKLTSSAIKPVCINSRAWNIAPLLM